MTGATRTAGGARGRRQAARTHPARMRRDGARACA
jgi:hypothetical protein